MNLGLVSKLLGLVALLIAVTMVFCLPFAFPWLSGTPQPEWHGFFGLLGAIAASAACGGILWALGRKSPGQMYRKEAMAVVGLSWVLATVLGALPFWFSGTYRAPAVKAQPAVGGQPAVAAEPAAKMTWDDWIFESQSGFSTTGATVLTELEDPSLVPRCILFWRSMTHFLGGLGIIVLFVAVLGQGSAGKALMRAEMPGPSKEGTQARMQHTALWFAGIYCGLNVLLTIILMGEGLTLFDALCHAFGTMATGGFSTYNASVGHFNNPAIEMTILVFMFLAGTNFTLFYLAMLRLAEPGKLWRRFVEILTKPGEWRKTFRNLDVEWRTYMGIIVLVTALVMGFGLHSGDFAGLWDAFRYGSFQVVAILTTTGYGTDDFDAWNSFGRGVLFLLMFVGGCAGSTGGGMKVIRHILFHKILRLEIEHAYRPRVVRPLRLAGEPLEDQELRKNILVYFGLVLVIFVFSWLFIVTVERHTLIDSASSVAATLNNIGPGLGTVGPTKNYAHFTPASKLLFTFLMMLGRLEIFPILVLVFPGFWRSR